MVTHTASKMNLRKRMIHFRPRLETLEHRLPPGDVLLGVLAGSTIFGASILEPESNLLSDPGSSLDLAGSKLRSWVAGAERSDAPEITPVIRRANRGFEDSTSATQNRQRHRTPDDSAPAFQAPTGRNMTAQGNALGWRSSFSDAALKGRNSDNLVPAISPHSGLKIGEAIGSQGVALGYHVPPLRGLSGGGFTPPPGENPTSKAQQVADYGKLPLSFEQNVGQFDSRVDFVARAGGSTVFLTPTAAVFSIQGTGSKPSGGRESPEATRIGGLTPPAQEASISNSSGAALHMQIVGGNPTARATGADQLPGIVNYFIGNDPAKWRTNISTYSRVEYDDVYPGIDLVYYGNQSPDREGAGLEYDFVVAPGVDPSAIELNFAGADGVEINAQGDLILHTVAGDVVQQKPFTYQDFGGSRQEVSSGYVLEGDAVRFEVGTYDAGRELVIDPVMMSYSTLLGGSAREMAQGIAVDMSRNAYITGDTYSQDFPTTAGAFDNTANGFDIQDVFVSKLSADGSTLLYSTYLGGTLSDMVLGIALDSSGRAHVVGTTGSSDFPITPGAFQTTHGGGFGGGYLDAFVTKLASDGASLSYSTFLGQAEADSGTGIFVDTAGSAYVTGATTSPGFPITSGAFDTTWSGVSDAFVTKFSPDGSGVTYSTFLGGQKLEETPKIAVDSGGNAYVVGGTSSSDFPVTTGAFQTSLAGSLDVFAAKLLPDGSSLAYATYIGGVDSEYVPSVAVNRLTGQAFIAGTTSSTDFPTTPGAFDTLADGLSNGFVARLFADGSGLVYSTYLGGAQSDTVYAIAAERNGAAIVTGGTTSLDFPVTSDALQGVLNGSFSDSFVTKLLPNGSALSYSTYLGGNMSDHARGVTLDRPGNIYVAGSTISVDFPTTVGAYDTSPNGEFDAFVTKLALS